MTVTYSAEVATSRGFGCFWKLLFRYLFFTITFTILIVSIFRINRNVNIILEIFDINFNLIMQK